MLPGMRDEDYEGLYCHHFERSRYCLSETDFAMALGRGTEQRIGLFLAWRPVARCRVVAEEVQQQQQRR